ncbi:helix-turn-helix domain-containing protein [Bacteroides reticulotermitis]|uniref:helix-turn-helix domain-containing protein n=1 Tax=Bacteroides reticulotermitis TaxID=1133319 RepID=UPI003A887A47
MNTEDKYNDGLNGINRRLDEVLRLLKAKNRLNGKTILDNQDICQMFNLSTRSLQRYRNSGELPFIRIAGKPFYIESEVRTFLETKKQNKPPDEDNNPSEE